MCPPLTVEIYDLTNHFVTFIAFVYVFFSQVKRATNVVWKDQSDNNVVVLYTLQGKQTKQQLVLCTYCSIFQPYL